MDYPEERKQYIDGIACQYLCHIEKAEKPGNVFSAHFHYYIEMLYAHQRAALISWFVFSRNSFTTA